MYPKITKLTHFLTYPFLVYSTFTVVYVIPCINILDLYPFPDNWLHRNGPTSSKSDTTYSVIVRPNSRHGVDFRRSPGFLSPPYFFSPPVYKSRVDPSLGTDGRRRGELRSVYISEVCRRIERGTGDPARCNLDKTTTSILQPLLRTI